MCVCLHFFYCFPFSMMNFRIHLHVNALYDAVRLCAYVCHPSSTSSSPPPSSSPSLLAVDFLFNDLQISHCISRVVCCWTIWATASRKTLLHEVVQCTYKFKLHILKFLSTSFCRYRSHTRRCAVFEFLQHHSIRIRIQRSEVNINMCQKVQWFVKNTYSTSLIIFSA